MTDEKTLREALDYIHRNSVRLLFAAAIDELVALRARVKDLEEQLAANANVRSNMKQVESDLAKEITLRARVKELEALMEPWRVTAQALADEVDVLVRRHIIDARSPAADALLDFRNPPMTPRSDRLTTLEFQLDEARADLRMALAERRDALSERDEARSQLRSNLVLRKYTDDELRTCTRAVTDLDEARAEVERLREELRWLARAYEKVTAPRAALEGK